MVGVIGAGSFGTAIANLLAYNREVLLYSRQSELVNSINTQIRVIISLCWSLVLNTQSKVITSLGLSL